MPPFPIILIILVAIAGIWTWAGLNTCFPYCNLKDTPPDKAPTPAELPLQHGQQIPAPGGVVPPYMQLVDVPWSTEKVGQQYANDVNATAVEMQYYIRLNTLPTPPGGKITNWDEFRKLYAAIPTAKQAQDVWRAIELSIYGYKSSDSPFVRLIRYTYGANSQNEKDFIELSNNKK